MTDYRTTSDFADCQFFFDKLTKPEAAELSLSLKLVEAFYMWDWGPQLMNVFFWGHKIYVSGSKPEMRGKFIVKEKIM